MSNGPSFQARRPSGKAEKMNVGDQCPQCELGRLGIVNRSLLTCDSCGFDVVIPHKEESEED